MMSASHSGIVIIVVVIGELCGGEVVVGELLLLLDLGEGGALGDELLEEGGRGGGPCLLNVLIAFVIIHHDVHVVDLIIVTVERRVAVAFIHHLSLLNRCSSLSEAASFFLSF